MALNKREDYYLAIARVRGEAVESLDYVQDPLAHMLTGDARFGLVAMVLELSELLKPTSAQKAR